MQEFGCYDISPQIRLEESQDREIAFSEHGKFIERPCFSHPKGFPVFLPADEIEGANEYSEGDPYSVETNLQSEFHRRRIDSTIELLRQALRSSPEFPRILDIGCGEGHITAEIKATFKEAAVSGFDYSVAAIEKATEKYPTIDFAVANAYQPPYASDYFDAVVINNLWEHVPDPLQLARAVRRMVRTGGHVIISTPSRYRFDNLLRALRGKPVRFMSASHVTEYTVGQIVEQLNFSGFQIEKIHCPPVPPKGKSIREVVAYKLLLPVTRSFLGLVGSHHSIESTVFYLARKRGSGLGVTDNSCSSGNVSAVYE